LFALGKIGEIGSDPNFINALITLFAAIATAVATIYIAKFTIELSKIGRQQASDARIIQRAYVTMSHKAPGIEVQGNSGLFYIDISIQNFGQTPAYVTDIVLKPVVIIHNRQLPANPDYSGIRTVFPKAFLVANEAFYLTHVLRVDPGEIDAVKSLMSDLYVIGYVDYIDKFGDRHRGGYARRYAPLKDQKAGDTPPEIHAKRNNLIFVTQHGYNYDYPRKRGEGEDWT
jgi:hypothetical protein